MPADAPNPNPSPDIAVIGLALRSPEDPPQESTEPQHHRLLECAAEVLESTEQDPERDRARMGLWVGSAEADPATWVALRLGLRGPALTVRSSPLMAIHLACRSLRDGESEMALAGSGDGAGVVLLKPLEAALADGDLIQAVIRGSALSGESGEPTTAAGLSELIGVLRSLEHPGGEETPPQAEVSSSIPSGMSVRLVLEAAPLREPAAASSQATQPALVPNPERWHEPFPLTGLQQVRWLAGSVLYQEIDVHRLEWTKLDRALQRTVARQDMLRAVLLPTGEQRVLAEAPSREVPVFDLTALPARARDEALRALRDAVSGQAFDPTRWPLFDLRAARIDGGRTRLFFAIDGLVGDAGSFDVLAHDLFRFASAEEEPAPLEISFRDHVLAEKPLGDTGKLDLPPAPELPMISSPAALAAKRFRRRTGVLDASSWRRLRMRGRRSGLSPDSLLLTAFAEVLAAWSRNPRLTLGVIRCDRPPVHPQIWELVGDFTALSLLAVDASQGGRFEARARAVHESLPIRSQTRSGGLPPLPPVIFQSALDLPPGLERSERVWGSGRTPEAVWLDHQVIETPKGGLLYHWNVAEALFPTGMMDSLFTVYRDLLRRLAEDDAAWSEERRRLIPTPQLARRVLANSTGVPLSQQRLQALFAAQAERHPDRPAVFDAANAARPLSYGALFRLSNRLGHHLRDLGARPNTLIAVVQEKGWEQVVSVLGILAAGAAYLPLDPGLPREHLRQLLEHGGVQIVVTTPGVEAALDLPEEIQRVVLEADGAGLPEEDGPLDPAKRLTDLAYVLFTGPLEAPRGVMIDHRAVVNTILDINRIWNVGPDDRVLAAAPLTDDRSVWDLFGPLAAGGAIVFPRADRIHREQVTRPDPARLARLAGAPEASIWSISEGRPLANQTLHVLDERLEPKPDLVTGHLYIGGVGLARGYWRDPEGSAERFVVHPETGERLFRTGRLARYLPDGRVELLGYTR